MACDRFTRTLKDHALGAPLDAAAAAHLAICSSCQDLLAQETRVLAAIDGAIEQLGRVRPAADFPARVREQASVSVRSRHVPWRVVAAGAVAAAVLMVVVLPGRPWRRAKPSPPAIPAIAVARTSSAPGVAAVAANPPLTAGQRRRTKNSPGTSLAAAQEADVLVPAGQPEVIARLLESLSRREPDVASRLVGQAVTHTRPDEQFDAPVSVAPIRIDAVDVPELPAPEPVGAK